MSSIRVNRTLPRFFHESLEDSAQTDSMTRDAQTNLLVIDLSTDTAAILDSIVSDIYYGMLRGQIHTNLPPEHPIIAI